jgi:DNA-binding beta-propeller fold protein YncE
MGGYFVPNTVISGTVGNPGIPFFNSPTGGFYATPAGGFGYSLSGQGFSELNTLNYFLGFKPLEPFAITQIAGSPFALPQASTCLSPNGTFLLTPDTTNSVVHVYLRNVITYAFVEVPGSPFATGLNPSLAVVSPDNLNVYVLNEGANSLSSFSMNQATGFLTPLGVAFVIGFACTGLVISPNGQYVMVCNDKIANDSIYVFSRNLNTGVLTQVAGSPFAVNGGIYPERMAFSPDGNFIYVTNQNNAGAVGQATLGVCKLNNANGVLTAVAQYPFNDTSSPSGVAVSPDGLSVYVCLRDAGAGNKLYAFNRDSITGKLTAAQGSPYAISKAYAVSVSKSGLFVYAISGGGGLYIYNRNAATGVLTPVAGSPFATSNTPIFVNESPDDHNIFVSDYSNGVLTVFQTTAAPTYHLIDAFFDPSGQLGGTFNINGQLQVRGLPVAQAGVSMASQYVGSSGGGTVAYTLTPAVPIKAYQDGQLFLFKANATNTTNAATFAVSGLGALPAKKGNVVMPAGGMVIGNYYWGLVELGGTSFRISPFDAASVNGDQINGALDFVVAGQGLIVSEAANGKQGVAALVAGTVVVANTSITANSRIILSPQETGLLTGIVRVSARTAGVSFTLLSTIITDTAVIAYEIFEPG